MPVGGVIAYEEHISVSGVGFDIGCGNMAVRLDTPYAAIKDNVGMIMQDVQQSVSFGVGRKNEERVEHALFDDQRWLTIPEITDLRAMARNQLGTVGSGNHYVDLF
jgi:tRNA-splicing ligase RtcB (3'-phosphate/5'-hydroxy nucleic acid ligase)